MIETQVVSKAVGNQMLIPVAQQLFGDTQPEQQLLRNRAEWTLAAVLRQAGLPCVRQLPVQLQQQLPGASAPSLVPAVLLSPPPSAPQGQGCLYAAQCILDAHDAAGRGFLCLCLLKYMCLGVE